MAAPRDQASLTSRPPLAAGALATLLVAGAVAWHRTGHELPLFESFERRTLDLRFQLRGPRPPGPEVAIVAFDDRTLAEAPTLFERRAGWAEVIRALSAAGVKGIGVDALFSDPEHVLPESLARDVDAYLAGRPTGPEMRADALLRRVQAETQGDADLERAIAAAGNVVLGLHLGVMRDGPCATDPSLARGKYGQSVPGPWIPRRAREVRASAAAFNRAARALGTLTVYEDETQSLRELPMVREHQQGVFAPLAVQLTALVRGLPRHALAYLGTEHAVRIGDVQVPLSGDDAITLNFRGPAGTFPTHSAIDVVRGRLPPGALKNRVVIVAATHLGRDTTRTSFGPGFPGPEMHATAIDNLLRSDPLVRSSWRTDGLVCLVLGLIATFLFWPRLDLAAGWRTASVLGLLVGWLTLSGWLFGARGLWLPWMGPVLTTLTVLALCLTMAYAAEGLQRRHLRLAFARYLADDVIEELIRDPRALSLGGERRHLTVLFSDIRGFTSFSERLPPEQLVKVLNTYLTPMTRAVLASGGFLDKFIGDAVMAVFGAPVPHPEHPSQALGCALRMHAELEALGPAMRALGVELRVGVGVNSGDMVVGNMGAEERFNYTVMGDAVNLTSRIEGLTKVYGVFCLVGDETRRLASPDLRFREVDLVQVKGREEPVALHELIEGPGRVIARYGAPERFAAGLAAWRAGRFPEARAAFLACLAASPEDPVARLYLDRLALLGDTPPPGWRGVTAHASK